MKGEGGRGREGGREWLRKGGGYIVSLDVTHSRDHVQKGVLELLKLFLVLTPFDLEIEITQWFHLT